MREKSLYAIADVTDGVQSTAINTFLLFYLTAACGMAGSLAGLALAIALVVDAITDPLFGYMSDNTNSKWGRRHPYMFAGIFPLSLTIGLIFAVPEFSSTSSQFFYVLIVLIAVRVSFSAFVLPYSALSAELSNDYTERSVIMTYRNFFNILGNFVCVFLGFGIFMSAENGLLDREAYVPFGWVCAAIMLIAGLISASSSLKLGHRLHKFRPADRPALYRFAGDIRNLARNRSFIILFLTVLIFWIGLGTAESLSVHALKYFWELPTSIIKNIMTARVVGLAIGILVCALQLKRLEKRDISAAGLAIIALCYFIPPILAVLGFMPGPGPALYVIMGSIYLIVGSQLTCLGISFASMMADAADEHDYLFGERREGLYFSSLTFSGKCALGVGALIAGISLDLIGFPKDLAATPDLEIPADTALHLGLIYGPAAAVIMFVSAAVLMRYRLNRQEFSHIQSMLGDR